MQNTTHHQKKKNNKTEPTVLFSQNTKVIQSRLGQNLLRSLEV